MYWLILALGVLGGSLLVGRGVTRRSRRSIVMGAIIAAGTLAFFAWMSFWGEALWFDALGYGDRFWKIVLTCVALGVAGAALGGAFAFVLARDRWTALLGAVVGLVWWAASWKTVLLFAYGSATGDRDPIFGLDVSFYLFELPLYSSLLWFLMVDTLLAAVAIGVRAGTSLGEDARNQTSLGGSYRPRSVCSRYYWRCVSQSRRFICSRRTSASCTVPAGPTSGFAGPATT